jgi:hypothetical protein
LKSSTLLALLLLALFQSFATEAEKGSICVAPIPAETPTTTGVPDLICQSNDFSFKIDGGRAVAWPHKQSLEISGLDATQRHKVIVLCHGKPQQSFGFRFSEFETRRLCLFINDLYQTVQLWDSKHAPWCKCK